MTLLPGAVGGYLGLGALVAIDSGVPLVPAELLVIAASGPADLRGLLVVFAVTAAGAFLGDLVVHGAGRRAHASRLGAWLRRRRWSTTHQVITSPGALIWGRFIPAGRTCVSFATGVDHLRWRTYLPFAAGGSLLWAGYTVALGRVGSFITSSAPLGIAAGVGLGLAVSGVVRIAVGRRPRRSEVYSADIAGDRGVEPAGVVPAYTEERRCTTW